MKPVHPVDELLAWAAAILRDVNESALPVGRFDLDAGWLTSARLRSAVYQASASDGPIHTWADAVLDDMQRIGFGKFYGIPTVVVPTADPPLRYVPHRDRLVFGASA